MGKIKKQTFHNQTNNDPKDLKWYEYTQNNSGGNFIINDQLGDKLFIQAYSAEEASTIAESKGVYFHGVDEGRDCRYCGDRWYKPYRSENNLEVNDKWLKTYFEEYGCKGMYTRVFVYHYDGTVDRYDYSK